MRAIKYRRALMKKIEGDILATDVISWQEIAKTPPMLNVTA